MALVVFREKIDFTSIPFPEEGGNIVGYDVNTGLLSQMDYQGVVSVIGTLGGGAPLSNILALGNATGTYSIVLDSIISNGTNRISLDNSTISITTDNGAYNESYLYLNSGNALFGNVNKSFRIENTGITTKWSDSDKQVIYTNTYELFLNNLAVLQFGKLSSGAGNKLSALISTDNSTISNSIVNTVVIGGQGISATQSNSVYIPNLYIQDGKVIKSTKGSGQIKITEFDIISSNSIGVIGLVSSTSSSIFTKNGIFIKDSATTSSSPNYDTGITYISSKNSSAVASIINSVIIGGDGLIASQDNTVYLPNVNINNLYTLPTTDGISNQVIVTDGLGNLSWTTVSSGGATGGSGGTAGITNTITKWTSSSTFGNSHITDDGTTINMNDSLIVGTNSVYTTTLNTVIGYRTNKTMGGNFNTVFGVNALKLNTTGSNNIAIGHNSLTNNITGSTNIAIGNSTLFNNTTGSTNFGVGYSVLFANTTGLDNTALGYLALSGNTSGSYNISIGKSAMLFNTIGSGGIGIGWQSLPRNTSGENNISIGRNGMFYSKTGDYNTAIGDSAAYFNILGSNNVAVGWQAAFENTTGVLTLGTFSAGSGYTPGTFSGVQLKYNSGSSLDTESSEYPFVKIVVGAGGTVSSVTLETPGHGFQATSTIMGCTASSLGAGTGFDVRISSIKSGNNNTIIGKEGFRYNTIGNDNVAIGKNAGNNTIAGTNIVSDNSIFIGSISKANATGQINQIVIGYDATGNGSNSVTIGNGSILKTILTGNVGFGLTGPSTKVDIYATQSGGGFKLKDTSEGLGYVLVSDVNGVASWTSSVTSTTAIGVISTTSSITTNTLTDDGYNQDGRCIIINNATYSINLTVDSYDRFTSTYLKHGTASISFVEGSGRTLIQVDGTLSLNGDIGSTATIISYGTTDYLRVSNA